MAYTRRDVKDRLTIMDKDLYDNLQDGIDELKEAVGKLGGDTTESNNTVVDATVE